MALPGMLAIEMAGLSAWPALETDRDGSWVRRAARGYTKRANSVQCVDPADDGDAGARVDQACAWFRARGIAPTFRVTPLCGPNARAALESWPAFDHSMVLAMPLERGAFQQDPGAELVPPLDGRWLEVQRALQGYDDHTLGCLADVVGVIDGPSRGVVLRDNEGAPVASALIAIADGIAVASNVVTASAARRRGFGSAMMRAALGWAADRGAGAAALAVVAENAAARRLYGGLGYTHVYDYHYRRPPA